jgi:hypothetical protein
MLTRDFKSLVSTNFTISAKISNKRNLMGY